MRRTLAAVAFALGVLGGCTCIDLNTPRPYPCFPDGGASQCPANWRCGLEQACHPIGAASSYLCTSDTDCEASWRCGPEGHCVNPQADSLRPNADRGNSSLSRISPLLPAGKPQLLAISEGFQIRGPCGALWSGRTVGYVLDGGLYVAALYDSGRDAYADGGVRTDCSAPYNPAATRLDLASAPLPPNSSPLAIAQVRDRTVLLSPNGAICSYRWDVSSGVSAAGCLAGGLNFAATDLRMILHDDQVVAFSPGALALYNAVDGGSSPLPIAAVSGNPVTLYDVAGAPANKSRFGTPYLMAATNRGMLVASLDNVAYYDAGTLTSPSWEPVTFSNTSCDRDSSPYAYPVRIRFGRDPSSSDPMLAAQVRQVFSDGGHQDNLQIYRPTDAGFFGNCPPVPTTDWGISGPQYYYDTSYFGGCGCPDGLSLKDFSFSFDSTRPNDKAFDIELRCDPGDGGSVDRFVSGSMGSCDQGGPPVPDTVRFSRPSAVNAANPFSSGFADDLGHLWYAQDNDFIKTPLLLDRTPSAAFGPSAQLLTYAPVLNAGAFDQTHAVTGQDVFTPQPLGLIAPHDFQIKLESDVESQENWTVAGSPRPEQASLLGVIQLDYGPSAIIPRIISQFVQNPPPKEPFHAATTLTPDGRLLLMVSTFDTLLTADVTDRANDKDAGFSQQDILSSPALAVRLVPLPSGPITSLTALPAAVGGGSDGGSTPYAEGYLTSADRLFHFQAANTAVWRADELSLGQALPIAVFHDGRRGRVGLQDGSILSLPSRVTLAPPLASGTQAVDFKPFCADVLLLASDGLYRLVADGSSPLGQWQNLPIDESLLPGPARTFVGGRLKATSTDVFVFLPSGYAIKVSGLQCP